MDLLEKRIKSFFRKYGCRQKVSIHRHLSVLPVVSCYAGDYRTPKELQTTFEENVAHEREQRMRSRTSHV